MDFNALRRNNNEKFGAMLMKIASDQQPFLGRVLDVAGDITGDVAGAVTSNPITFAATVLALSNLLGNKYRGYALPGYNPNVKAVANPNSWYNRVNHSIHDNMDKYLKNFNAPPPNIFQRGYKSVTDYFRS